MGNTIFVTNSQDTGEGSLRDAFSSKLVPGNNKIIIKSTVVNSIVLTSGQIDISIQSNAGLNNITLEYENPCGRIVISSATSRIFSVDQTINIFNLEKVSLSGAVLGSNSGGAISFNSSGLLKLVCSKISGSKSGNLGGAIYSSTGKFILEKTELIGNSALNQGGAIWSGSNVTLFQSKVSGNFTTSLNASSGGGGIYVDAGDVTVVDSKVNGNYSPSGSGGAIIVMNGNITASGSKINGNWAFNSGGIQMGIGNIYILSKSEANKNYSTNTVNPGGAAAITINVGSVKIENSEVSYNRSEAMMAPGVVSILGDVLVSGSKLIGNFGNGPAGAIACNFDGSIVVNDSVICGNTGASLGGAFVNFSTSGTSVPEQHTSTTGIISITNSKVRNNTLTNAQTIRQTLAVFFSLFENLFKNISDQALLNGAPGGQLFIGKIPELLSRAKDVSDQLNALVLPYEGNFIGGGVLATLLPSQVICSESEFEGNYAGKEAIPEPFTAIGGAFFTLNGPLTGNGIKVKINVAKNSAGAIWTNSVLNLVDSKIIGNTVDQGEVKYEGLYLAPASVTTLISTKVVNEIVNLGELYLINSEIISCTK